jgi:hypothetical protein
MLARLPRCFAEIPPEVDNVKINLECAERVLLIEALCLAIGGVR